MEIDKLLDGIEKLDLVVPEFQREYVWSLEDAKQLMISLFKEYPTGSLLMWETDEPPEIKNDAVQRGRIGLTKVILDGQQRLTTLYLLMRGAIPPYYNEEEIVYDPRHLHFNLKTGEFLYEMKSKMQNDPFWKRVVDCFTEGFDAFTLMKEIDTEDVRLGATINENLNKLRAIRKITFPVQTIPSNANIDEAIDVFDRVNSRGTKLTDAELVLTHVTGKWPKARRVMKEKSESLGKLGFAFELEFFTRCLVVALTRSALLDGQSIHYEQKTQEDYQAAWQKVSKALDYLIPILQQTALLGGTDDLNTTNVLVPVVARILYNEGKFLSEAEKNGFLYWMFLALIWQQYSGQTDQKLDKDVHLAMDGENPIPDLVNEIQDERGRIEVKPDDLEGRGSSHPLYKMLYIITKHKKAIDWANGGTIYGTLGDHFSIQSHHIFPQAVLYRNGYVASNHLQKKLVNEIANRAFITRDTNYEISDKEPSDYLPAIEEEYAGALERQLIPMDRTLWHVERYDDFLRARRKLIAESINEFLASLKESSTEEAEESDWKSVISKGENNYVEFKSSLRFDAKTKQVNKALEFAVAKAICAFLNSEGGKLFIGVSDDGSVGGLDGDYSFIKGQKQDGFLQQLIQTVNNYLGKEFNQYIIPRIEDVEGKDVCLIEVSASGTPVFLKKDGQEEFFIRASASSQPMSMREASEYMKMHWNN
ncbi:MAG: DUF262 domain-containing protein [Candidatus Peribacteraceae bacterium]|nr:DUF262 domain-containing protein [Candidatus Peribacteraceae bacterium]